MSRFRLVSLAVVALAIGGAAVMTVRIRQRGHTPVYSLQQLANAARAKDRAGIERYLDVGRTAESMVDEVIATASAREDVDPTMKPMLVSTLELGIWSMLIDSLATLENRYQGLAGVAERDDVARVGVHMRTPDGDSTFVVQLRMERAAGRWRVVGVEDLGPYLQATLARREGRAREAEQRSMLRNRGSAPP